MRDRPAAGAAGVPMDAAAREGFLAAGDEGWLEFLAAAAEDPSRPVGLLAELALWRVETGIGDTGELVDGAAVRAAGELPPTRPVRWVAREIEATRGPDGTERLHAGPETVREAWPASALGRPPGAGCRGAAGPRAARAMGPESAGAAAGRPPESPDGVAAHVFRLRYGLDAGYPPDPPDVPSIEARLKDDLALAARAAEAADGRVVAAARPNSKRAAAGGPASGRGARAGDRPPRHRGTGPAGPRARAGAGPGTEPGIEPTNDLSGTELMGLLAARGSGKTRQDMAASVPGRDQRPAVTADSDAGRKGEE